MSILYEICRIPVDTLCDYVYVSCQKKGHAEVGRDVFIQGCRDSVFRALAMGKDRLIRDATHAWLISLGRPPMGNATLFRNPAAFGEGRDAPVNRYKSVDDEINRVVDEFTNEEVQSEIGGGQFNIPDEETRLASLEILELAQKRFERVATALHLRTAPD